MSAAGPSTSPTTIGSADGGGQGHSGGERIGSRGFGVFVSVLVMAATRKYCDHLVIDLVPG